MGRKLNTTSKGGTLTTKGFIPHLKHKAGFYMPVKIKSSDTIINSSPRPPQKEKESGFLIYALPGGGDYISANELVYGVNKRAKQI